MSNAAIANQATEMTNQILATDAGKQGWRQVSSDPDTLLTLFTENKTLLNSAFTRELGPLRKFSELNTEQKYATTQGAYNFLVNLAAGINQVLETVTQINEIKPDKKQLQKMMNKLLRELQKQNQLQQQNIEQQNIDAQNLEQTNQLQTVQTTAQNDTVLTDQLTVEEQAATTNQASAEQMTEREALQTGDLSYIDPELAADPAAIDAASKTIDDPGIELEKAQKAKKEFNEDKDTIKHHEKENKDTKDVEKDFKHNEKGLEDTEELGDELSNSPEPNMSSSPANIDEEEFTQQQNAMSSFSDSASGAPSLEDFTSSLEAGAAGPGAEAASAGVSSEAAMALAL